MPNETIKPGKRAGTGEKSVTNIKVCFRISR